MTLLLAGRMERRVDEKGWWLDETRDVIKNLQFILKPL